MKSTISKQIIGTGLIVAMAIIFLGMMISQNMALGSVSVTDEYQATTTGAFSGSVVPVLIKTGPSTLGSVVITGAAAGRMYFYDATTSDVNLRASNLSTSSVTRVMIPVSAAAGTYTFDVMFGTGLLMNIEATQPTTTVTFR